jgi:hypothetical protein
MGMELSPRTSSMLDGERMGRINPKTNQKKFSKLMTTMRLYTTFSSYYLLYLIDSFGFVIDDLTELSVFHTNKNGLFTKFTIQLIKERMKAIEQKNDGYGSFCKNILNAVYGKDGMNQSRYSKLVIMDQKKAFFSMFS